MIAVYLDTNVLLSKWAQNYPYHVESLQIINAIETQNIDGYFSAFGLAEIASVVERQKKQFALPKYQLVSIADEYIKAVRAIKNLNILEYLYPARLNIGGIKTTISAIHLRSIYAAKEIGLKTLDNIHIAIIDLLQKIELKKLDFFITGDGEIVANQVHIQATYGYEVLNPAEFIKQVL